MSVHSGIEMGWQKPWSGTDRPFSPWKEPDDDEDEDPDDDDDDARPGRAPSANTSATTSNSADRRHRHAERILPGRRRRAAHSAPG